MKFYNRKINLSISINFIDFYFTYNNSKINHRDSYLNKYFYFSKPVNPSI